MPKSNAEKVAECVEIIGKGVFSTYEIDFLRNMEKLLQDPDFELSVQRQRFLNAVYEKACDSPY